MIINGTNKEKWPGFYPILSQNWAIFEPGEPKIRLKMEIVPRSIINISFNIAPNCQSPPGITAIERPESRSYIMHPTPRIIWRLSLSIRVMDILTEISGQLRGIGVVFRNWISNWGVIIAKYQKKTKRAPLIYRGKRPKKRRR